MTHYPHLPIAFVDRIVKEMGAEAQDFLEALAATSEHAIRLHPFKLEGLELDLASVPWAAKGYYTPDRSVFASDPLWHAGAYYVQESSSMFLSHILETVLKDYPQPLVLDLCASPGGKSTIISSFLFQKQGFLVANEVIQGRLHALRENIYKWGIPNTWVTNRDASFWGSKKDIFDCVVVDAPCSGEGMFRKDPQSRVEWREDSPAFCAARQKRIVEEVLPCLKSGGYFIYSTCTFNSNENGDIVSFLETQGLQVVTIEIEEEWGITAHDKGYAFWPHKVRGEGFFISVFRKKAADTHSEIAVNEKKDLKRKEIALRPIVQNLPFSLANEWQTMLADSLVFLLHPSFTIHYNRLSSLAKIEDIAWRIAEIKGKDIIPLPESGFIIPQILTSNQTHEVTNEQALSYLRKEDPLPGAGLKGWVLLHYKGVALGWLKGIGNRNNNIYPLAYRLHKSNFEFPEELL